MLTNEQIKNEIKKACCKGMVELGAQWQGILQRKAWDNWCDLRRVPRLLWQAAYRFFKYHEGLK